MVDSRCIAAENKLTIVHVEYLLVPKAGSSSTGANQMSVTRLVSAIVRLFSEKKTGSYSHLGIILQIAVFFFQDPPAIILTDGEGRRSTS